MDKQNVPEPTNEILVSNTKEQSATYYCTHQSPAGHTKGRQCPGQTSRCYTSALSFSKPTGQYTEEDESDLNGQEKHDGPTFSKVTAPKPHPTHIQMALLKY